jgi:hypothetical protein
MQLGDDYLNAELILGDLDINLLSSITIKDIYVVSESDTIAGCKELRLGYKLHRLMSGELYIVSLAIDDPLVNLAATPEGEIDLSWLKIIEETAADSIPSDTIAAEIDTAAVSLPVSVKLRRLTINNARASLSGAQNISVRGFSAEVSDLSAISMDSIYAHVEMNLKADGSDNIRFSYEDSSATLAADGRLDLSISGDIEPENHIVGEAKIAGMPLRIRFDDIYYQADFNTSAEFDIDMASMEVAVPSFKMALNDRTLLDATLRMKLTERDTIPPMEVIVKKASLDIGEFKDIISELMPGASIEGNIGAENLTIINNEEYPGIKVTGQFGLRDFYAGLPEYGLTINNLGISSKIDGIATGDKAGFDVDIEGGSDSILFRLDETTLVTVPATHLRLEGKTDTLFLPERLHGQITASNIFGSDLVADLSLEGGIPPAGKTGIRVEWSDIDINRAPYSEYDGRADFLLDFKTIGDSLSCQSSLNLKETTLDFENDYLFIPELPVRFSCRGSFDERFADIALNEIKLRSPSLFDIDDMANVKMSDTIFADAVIEGHLYHDYLEDFIPFEMKDSLGGVTFTGQTDVQCSLFVEVADDGGSSSKAYGRLSSAIDNAAVELYGFDMTGMNIESQFSVINAATRAYGDIYIDRISLEDTLTHPLEDIEGRFSVSFKDSVLDWGNTRLTINSHRLQVASSGKYVMGEYPTMNLKANLDFNSSEPVKIFGDIGISGRLQSWADISMNDSLMNIRGSLNPLMLSASAPGMFSISSVSGNIPFEQAVSLDNMRLTGDPAVKEELNLLDYEQDKYFGAGRSIGTIQFSRLEASRVFVENFSLTLEIGKGIIVGRRLYTDVYGGNLLGDFMIDLRSIDPEADDLGLDSLRYAMNLQMSAVNFDRLAGSRDISTASDISGDMSVSGRGIVDPEGDYELEGQINITRIGPRATRKLLDFLDPAGTDLSIAETRKLMDRKVLFLDISYQPKSFSLKIKHGNVNPSIDMDQPFFAKYLRIGVVTMPVEYDRKQLQALLKATSVPVEGEPQ